MPLSPPIRNWRKNASPNSIDVRSTRLPPMSVPIMSKYSIPAGTMSKVDVNAKYRHEHDRDKHATCNRDIHREQVAVLVARVDERSKH